MTSVSLLNFPLSLPPLPPAINFKEVRKETPRGGEGGSLLCVYYERSNANSKAQSGKPKGILKDEFCIPMFCVRTAPSALCWSYTIRRRGRATCSVDQYTHGRRLGQHKARTRREALSFYFPQFLVQEKKK